MVDQVQNDWERIGFEVGSFIINQSSVNRTTLAQMVHNGRLGLDKDKRRSIADEAGYPDYNAVTLEDYYRAYNSDPIAGRVVEAMPFETWKVLPEVFDSSQNDTDEDTQFKKDWNSLSFHEEEDYYDSESGILPIWEYARQLDVEAGLGRYAVMFLGIDDNMPLNRPPNINKKNKLLFVRVLPELHAPVNKIVTNRNHPRFGLPLTYNINFSDDTNTNITHPLDTEMTRTGVGSYNSSEVHWQRVIHLADNTTGTVSEYAGVPRMRPVFNNLMNLYKLYATAPEMYFRGAFMGIAFQSIPEAVLNNAIPKFTDQKEDYERFANGLQRSLSVHGQTVESIAPQVVDPTANMERQLDAIAIRMDMPKRILIGSERGELSSEQDDARWNSKVRARHHIYGTPRIVRPIVRRLINLNIVTKPRTTYGIAWPDLESQTDLSKSTVTLKLTQALSFYMTSNIAQIMPPAYYLTKVVGFPKREVDAFLAEIPEPLGTIEAIISMNKRTGAGGDPVQILGREDNEPDGRRPTGPVGNNGRLGIV